MRQAHAPQNHVRRLRKALIVPSLAQLPVEIRVLYLEKCSRWPESLSKNSHELLTKPLLVRRLRHAVLVLDCARHPTPAPERAHLRHVFFWAVQYLTFATSSASAREYQEDQSPRGLAEI